MDIMLMYNYGWGSRFLSELTVPQCVVLRKIMLRLGWQRQDKWWVNRPPIREIDRICLNSDNSLTRKRWQPKNAINIVVQVSLPYIPSSGSWSDPPARVSEWSGIFFPYEVSRGKEFDERSLVAALDSGNRGSPFGLTGRLDQIQALLIPNNLVLH